MNQQMGIGDRLQFTHFPENIFKLTGEKVIDLDKDWTFDYNPYVVRHTTEIPSVIIDLWNLSYNFPKEGLSTADRFIIKYLGKDKLFCRGPRLYRFEEKRMIPNKIIVHLGGKTVKTEIKDNVLKYIRERYSDFTIYQIGGKNDKTNDLFINKMGLSLWDTVELISDSAIFLGINSGFMNVALAYPRICKKLFIDEQCLTSFLPMRSGSEWYDYNTQFWNQTENDIGITHSYLRI